MGLDNERRRATQSTIETISPSATVVKLVNDSFQDAFPGEFGDLIPPMVGESVRIVTASQYEQLHSRLSVVHPFRKALDQEAMIQMGISRLELPTPSAFTTNDTPRQIYVSDEVMGDFVVAKLLLHEHLHQIANLPTFQVTESDTLFQFAFSIDRYSAASEDDQTKIEIIEKRNQRLIEYASLNDPKVMLDGAIVSLFCDYQGQPLLFACAGYDLNEALVEMLIGNAKVSLGEKFTDTIKKTDVTADLLTIASLFETALVFGSSSSSARVRDYSKTVDGLLESIDLKTTPARLKAYRSGDIPKVIAQKYPNHFYPM